MYQELIDEDLDMLIKLGMEDDMNEINGELAVRLSGEKNDDGLDDQEET